MADVFLSYQKRDRELAERTAAALRAEGLSVWWDDDLTPRENWDRTIEREIAAARHVLVLWTAASIESDWVRREANFALNCGVPKLAQIRFDGVDLPLAFSMTQYVELGRDWVRNEAGWQRLVGWLTAGGRKSGGKSDDEARGDAAEDLAPAMAFTSERSTDIATDVRPLGGLLIFLFWSGIYELIVWLGGWAQPLISPITISGPVVIATIACALTYRMPHKPDYRPLIEIGPRGILYRRLSTRPIPWAAIEYAVSPRELDKKCVKIGIKAEEIPVGMIEEILPSYLRNRESNYMYLRHENEQVIEISYRGLESEADRIVELISAYVETGRRPQDASGPYPPRIIRR